MAGRSHEPADTKRSIHSYWHNHKRSESLSQAYATRAIESGMQPKVLQKLLGHASIKTTMDRYVHVTDDSMNLAVQQFEKLFA